MLPRTQIDPAREAFARDGFYISPPILAPALLDRAIAAQEELYARGHARTRPPILPAIRRSGTSTKSRKNPYAYFHHSAFEALVSAPTITALACDLLGVSELRYWHDQLLFAAGGQDEVDPQWHTERSRWLSCSSNQMLTAWIPLQSMAVEHGPITAVRGSHRWEAVEIEEMVRAHGSLDAAAMALGHSEMEHCPATLERGQVFFMHCLTVHGNPANRAPGPRRAMAVHYMGAEVEYQACGRFSHVNERYCRRTPEGLPDYRDPAMFPVLSR